ncbi:hypothetical protein GA614_00810 [Bifidobacterium adolescentis]|nr:hypothetical protein GA614_00810 [Bifidobacterium adolescentis]
MCFLESPPHIGAQVRASYGVLAIAVSACSSAPQVCLRRVADPPEILRLRTSAATFGRSGWT